MIGEVLVACVLVDNSMEGLLNGTEAPSYHVDEKHLRRLRHGQRKSRKERKAARREKKRRKLIPRADEDEMQVEEEAGREETRRPAEEGHILPAMTSMSDPESIVASPSSLARPPTSRVAPTSARPVKHSQSGPEHSQPEPPITPEPSEARRILKRPRRAPSPAPDPENRMQAQPTDDELRYRFALPGAMDAYLASKWLNLQELKRLADDGGTSLPSFWELWNS